MMFRKSDPSRGCQIPDQGCFDVDGSPQVPVTCLSLLVKSVSLDTSDFSSMMILFLVNLIKSKLTQPKFIQVPNDINET